ncbi:MAG: exodeoxyribonuclease VII large subunit [Chloroflexota bacterium]
MVEAVDPPQPRALRVSDVTRYLKEIVERDDVLMSLSVRGEISDLSRPASGHVYFTLRDSSSQISCVLFRREALKQSDDVHDLRRGASVVVHGFLTLYEPRGTYQIYTERIVKQGDGADFQRLERLKQRLEQEGLFAADRKRALPPFPKKLALVTSPGSQAYHDVLHRLRSQYPFVKVVLAGASVQGDGAGDEMAMAIDIVNRLTDVDVILLVRGGGAPEELAAFNEERLTRTIFASRVPVITGIGHETDYTLADLVADWRSATPSLAAAAAVPDVAALVHRSSRLHQQLAQSVEARLRAERTRWAASNTALLRASPQARVQLQRTTSERALGGLHRGLTEMLRRNRAALAALQAQLQSLDPLAILHRGYAVLTDPQTGQVVSRESQVFAGQSLEARVRDGTFRVRVENA